METLTFTPLSLPTSESASGREFDSGATWLEVKKRRRGLVTKRRKPLPLPTFLALRRRSISTVTYSRTAFTGPGWRITFDRVVQHKGSFLSVSLEGKEVPAVVVEVKGSPPKRVLRALGLPNKQFSKSRWALGAR